MAFMKETMARRLLVLLLAMLVLQVRSRDLRQADVPAGCNCRDTVPPGATCAQRKEWGQCHEYWMKKAQYCNYTCGVCKCDRYRRPAFWYEGGSQPVAPTPPASDGCDQCTDEAPSYDFTCEQQKNLGKCGESWMQGYCKRSCGQCACS